MVTDDTLLERAHAAAASVTDPELPPLTIEDLGILRDVRLDHGTVEVAITPTYSGCTAMREIAGAIEIAVHAAGADADGAYRQGYLQSYPLGFRTGTHDLGA